MAFRWQADDVLVILVFGDSLPLSNNNNNKTVKVGPPLTKHSGSAHVVGKTYLGHLWLQLMSVRSCVTVDSLFIVATIVCWGVGLGHCYAILYFVSFLL